LKYQPAKDRDMSRWDCETENFSGDVRLQGRRETVGLRGVEDAYVSADAVAGALKITDAEYVFTDQPADAADGVPPEAVDTEVAGDLEDGYVEAVDDAVVAETEDVFIERGAAQSLEVEGVEQVFRDDDAPPDLPDTYDVSLTGWNHSREARDPETGVSLLGARNEITVSGATTDLVVYVTGWENEVRLEGRGASVDVHFVGRDNTVSTSPYVTATVETESGFDNTLDSDPLPHEAIIETEKDEAFGFLGRHKATWQEPAEGKDWCPNCGESADAVIARRQTDAFFVFGIPVRTYDDGGKSFECEHCTRHAIGEVGLSESERKSALR